MPWRNGPDRWGTVAKAFHWGMAALILAMMVLGWVAESWPVSRTKLELFYWHKSIGVLILALALARLGWRVVDRAPALPATMSRVEGGLARAAHGALYGLMVAMPLSGWVINSAANFPFKVFGLLPLPALVEPSKATQQLAQDVHLVLFWVLAVVLTLHVAAALHHHFRRRDAVLRRMLPFAQLDGGVSAQGPAR